MNTLPALKLSEWRPNRDYLREVCLVLSSSQRAFLPKHPRQWQYGLEVNLRGLSTQEFVFKGQPLRATLDLVGNKVRLADQKWPLRENPPALVLQNIQAWLTEQGDKTELEVPEFAGGVVEFNPDQAASYAEALWWLAGQFSLLKDSLKEGATAPILLYPHHFDLSLVWFPFDTGNNDERQLAIGWSTGDEHIPEAYIYLTAYPEPKGFTELGLPKEAHWQKAGFSGAILPYEMLRKSPDPAALFKEFAAAMSKSAKLFKQ